MRAVVGTAKAQEALAAEEVEMLKNSIAVIEETLAFDRSTVAGGESYHPSVGTHTLSGACLDTSGAMTSGTIAVIVVEVVVTVCPFPLFRSENLRRFQQVFDKNRFLAPCRALLRRPPKHLYRAAI